MAASQVAWLKRIVFEFYGKLDWLSATDDFGRFLPPFSSIIQTVSNEDCQLTITARHLSTSNISVMMN
jgi:hypothetical protein